MFLQIYGVNNTLYTSEIDDQNDSIVHQHASMLKYSYIEFNIANILRRQFIHDQLLANWCRNQMARAIQIYTLCGIPDFDDFQDDYELLTLLGF